MTKSLHLLRDGVAELGLTLGDAELSAFSRFADELVKWNRKINLTAITSEKDMIVKHFLDSLTVAARLPIFGNLLDIGSGAGFPGIPLSILNPELNVISVDAVEKKILFQRHAARILGLGNFVAHHARGESLAERYGSYFDIIISRAFTDLVSFSKMVLPLLTSSGKIVAMKGSEGKAESCKSEAQLTALGLSIVTVDEYCLPISGDKRSLIVINKARNLIKCI